MQYRWVPKEMEVKTRSRRHLIALHRVHPFQCCLLVCFLLQDIWIHAKLQPSYGFIAAKVAFVSPRDTLSSCLSLFICTAYVEIGTCIACHMLHGSNKTLLLDCVVVPLLFHLYVIQLHNHHYSWVSNQSFWPVVNTKGKKAFGRGLLSCTSPGS